MNMWPFKKRMRLQIDGKKELLVKTNFATLFWYPDLKCVSEVWTSASEFSNFGQRKEYHIEKVEATKSLAARVVTTDAREFKVIPDFEELDWFFEYVMNSTKMNEIDRCAIVMPPLKLFMATIEMSTKKGRLNYELKYFSNPKKAYEWMDVPSIAK